MILNSFKNPLQAHLYESHESGFTSSGRHHVMAFGSVKFDYCVEEMLAVLGTPDCKTRIVTFDWDVLRIGREKPRHISGMETRRISNREHRWFTLEFKFLGINSMDSLSALRLQVAALTLLSPTLVDDSAVQRNINEMIERHRSTPMV